MGGGNTKEKVRKGPLVWLGDCPIIRHLRDWGIKYSLWPVHFTTACCGCEIAAFSGPKYDAERFGVLPFFSPRTCNLLLIEGTITKKMAKAVKIIYEQMPDPKFVIAMGSCALDGGLFWNSYNIVRPHKIVPVDVFITGCPPRPEAVLRSATMIQDKIGGGRLRLSEYR
ncbi:MAG: NADH-quinone oxidoreductase subunit B [Candidatus Methanomethylicota archaeon]|uniref:NADH-quinone oxidoreductase subunit B n=1 Tax=Thermoproteota archaeon TaxID=2056631 RepID=A0A497EMC1_9CREN|nr:MAG: NADH-quinone oxidoreductase subunit B [Candidatus Verstraetearchaeota archaeon]